jgi:hypothetical protein
MPQWRDFLERFRPAGTPGAAAQGGVPADRIADTAAELEPLFLILDDVAAKAARIRRGAAEQAEVIRQDAGRRAADIVAEAWARAETARAEAAAQARAATVTEDIGTDAARRAELDDLQARVAARMPDYVEKVVVTARALLEEFCGPGDAAAPR